MGGIRKRWDAITAHMEAKKKDMKQMRSKVWPMPPPFLCIKFPSPIGRHLLPSRCCTMEIFQWPQLQGEGSMGCLNGWAGLILSEKGFDHSDWRTSAESGWRFCDGQKRFSWVFVPPEGGGLIARLFLPTVILGLFIKKALLPPTLVHWGMKLGWGQATWLTEGWEGKTHCIWKGVLSKRHW